MCYQILCVCVCACLPVWVHDKLKHEFAVGPLAVSLVLHVSRRSLPFDEPVDDAV